MLGSVKQSWNWIGSGKHPAVGDFFKVGRFTPILEAIADWLEKGFQHYAASESGPSESLHSHNSWRFWIKSPKADHLVVGVVRDSSDSLGRPYPFLVAGTGPLKKIETHWELLPFACERIWSQMEYLGTGQFADVKQIEERVSHIHSPDRDWSRKNGLQGGGADFSAEPDQMSMNTQEDIHKMEKHIETLLHQPEFFVSLDTGSGGDPLIIAGLWHRVFKKKLAAFPNALFMGGVPERTCLAVFQRSLSPHDFSQLWSVHKNEKVVL
jgi:type VI secretion system ImpM family protein